ncbi:type VII toxin-antitoxin system MntA family adenylyltransferase antitoxin [Thioalbus denitrificans]|uniref:type VII toxin-antitoxin system MntA family adenylyltransferase antitoxin n=1 Tax=Thioalbus denitrificans TaxID=547122 RepID=UPI000DF2CE55|nr:nucleotidyltransferase domain-containing protein [Thioalbus denitrificans]
MDGDHLSALSQFLREEPAVLFAYLFGSRARGTHGPMSDFDIAVHLAQNVDLFTFRLQMLEQLNRLLKTDKVDLVVLNDAPLLLRHRVIRDGRLLKEHHDERVRFESRTLRDYLDSAYLRRTQTRARPNRVAPEVPRGR